MKLLDIIKEIKAKPSNLQLPFGIDKESTYKLKAFNSSINIKFIGYDGKNLLIRSEGEAEIEFPKAEVEALLRSGHIQKVSINEIKAKPGNFPKLIDGQWYEISQYDDFERAKYHGIGYMGEHIFYVDDDPEKRAINMSDEDIQWYYSRGLFKVSKNQVGEIKAKPTTKKFDDFKGFVDWIFNNREELIPYLIKNFTQWGQDGGGYSFDAMVNNFLKWRASFDNDTYGDVLRLDDREDNVIYLSMNPFSEGYDGAKKVNFKGFEFYVTFY